MTTHRVLKNPLCTYRIGDGQGEFPVFSAEGAKRYPGRWNIKNQAILYSSNNYSTAVLEKLVYLGEMPPNQHYIEITIPTGVSYEEITSDTVPGWFESNRVKAKSYGSDWYNEQRSLILIVPSIVARLDNNVLINTTHPDFEQITVSNERAILWDDRLFI